MEGSAWLEFAQGIRIRRERLVWLTSRGGGPGGQSVNTTDSRVQLVLRIADLVGGDPGFAERLQRLAGARAGADGSLILVCGEDRSQHRNRATLLERLRDLVDRAARRPRKRRPTRPTRGSVQRRLDVKKQRGSIKDRRRGPPDEGG